jgi:hypothetical protein
MLNQSADYALRVVQFLARDEHGRSRNAETIAAAGGRARENTRVGGGRP